MARIDADRLRVLARRSPSMGPTEFGYATSVRRRRRSNRTDDDALTEGDGSRSHGPVRHPAGELERNAEIVRDYERARRARVTHDPVVPAVCSSTPTSLASTRSCASRTTSPASTASSTASASTTRRSRHRQAHRGADRRRLPCARGRRGDAWRRATTGGDPFAHLRPCDAAIATFWTSRLPGAALQPLPRQVLLRAGLRARLLPGGLGWALAEETWHFGFPGIVNTPGLADVYRSYGNPAVSFVPRVDTERYHPPAPSRPPTARPLKVFFYGRPTQPRNAFGLGLAALAQASRTASATASRSSRAGATGIPGAYGVLGADREPRRAAAGARSPSCTGRATSASSSCSRSTRAISRSSSWPPGMVTVTNANPATEWLLRHDENALVAPPAASLIAEQIGAPSRIRSCARDLPATALAEVRARALGGSARARLGRDHQARRAVRDAAGPLTAARRSMAPRG